MRGLRSGAVAPSRTSSARPPSTRECGSELSLYILFQVLTQRAVSVSHLRHDLHNLGTEAAHCANKKRKRPQAGRTDDGPTKSSGQVDATHTHAHAAGAQAAAARPTPLSKGSKVTELRAFHVCDG